MRRFVLAAFALAALAGCQPATTELTDEQKAEIVAEVNMTLDSFWDSWRQTDYDRAMAFYIDSPETAHAVTDGGIVKGFDSMDRTWRSGFTAVASQRISFEETFVSVLGRDAVCVMQRGAYSSTDTTGVTGPTFPLAYTTVWIRTEAGWRVTAAHQSIGDAVTE